MARNRNRARGRNRDGKRRRGDLSNVEQIIKQAVRGSGRLAFGDALEDVRKDIRGARNQRGVIDAAYDNYIARLGELQGAGAAMAQQLQGSQGAMNAQLIGALGQGAQAGAAQAGQQAAVLGQGSAVSDAYSQAGAMGQQALAGRAAIASRPLADIGLGFYSDLNRRAATGERAKLEAQMDRKERIAELKREKRGLKRDKGAFMAERLAQEIQQQEENAIARAGLRLDRKGQKHDELIDSLGFRLDAYDTIADNQRADRDQRDGNRGGGGGGGDGDGGGGGLSASDAKYRRSLIQRVEAARQRMDELVKGGMSVKEARRRAQSQGNHDEWIVRVASDLIKNGRLTGSTLTLAKSKLPGQLPDRWR